ncbi:pitrilysin family protein [Phenylobacterium sp.]|uniref:M16 family metallopeptidase n=1 Tax=Phenylobacterium sp. TaxID=1871053 RepID=UPI001217813A|nr:pitrilysin family protein [Phenylobacterium sp.]THD58459.1 MAG: insulinase family protein [Phenylobacterium sp.]
MALAFGGAIAQPGAAQSQATAAPAALGVAADPSLVRWDPAIRYGVLPNGLRYAVQRSSLPKGAMSLRLGIGVGSFDEADDERGAAHLIEHLAFDGSRSFPEHQLDLIFAPLHVTFAHDRNASSDLKQTVYQLDLQSTDASGMDVATRWLRDVADGLSFADAAVARERAAMETERKTRAADVLRALRARMDAFEDGDLRSNARFPLGTPDSLAAMTPARLKAFYDRWYRPDNASVVLVGDLPVDVLEQKVKAVFGDWAPRGPAGVRAPRAPPAAPRGAEALVLTDAELPAIAGICRVAPPEAGGSTDERLHALLLRGLWEAILQQRINVLRSRKDAPFVEATISDETRPDSLKSCVGIIPLPGQEVRAVGMIEAEIRRFAAEGPTEDETDAGLQQVRGSVRGAIAVNTDPSRDRATKVLDRTLDGMPQLAPREGLRAFDVLMEDVRPENVRVAFARDWSGWGPLAPVNSPRPLSADEIKTAMTGDAYKSTGAK